MTAAAVTSADAHRGHLRRKGWHQLSYGLYVPDRATQGLADRLRAWSLVLPSAAMFTSLTAAAVYRWWQPAQIVHPVFIALPEQEPRPRRAGVLVCRHPAPVAGGQVEGLSVTTPAETLLAAARTLGLLDLVILGDSALRLGHCTRSDLRAAAARRRRGAPLLRAVIPLLDARSESPWESVMRTLHRAAEIEVEPQYEIRDGNGAFVARADLWVKGTRRIHEYDGEVHRDPRVHADDLRRERRLLVADWQRVGFTARHLRDEARSILTETDTLLGRSWDPNRLRAWQHLLDHSLLTARGRARAYARWQGATTPQSFVLPASLARWSSG